MHSVFMPTAAGSANIVNVSQNTERYVLLSGEAMAGLLHVMIGDIFSYFMMNKLDLLGVKI